MNKINEYNKAMDWVRNGVEGLYHEGEDEIVKWSTLCYFYAADNIKGRFTAGEDVMRKSGSWPDYIRFLKSKGIEI